MFICLEEKVFFAFGKALSIDTKTKAKADIIGTAFEASETNLHSVVAERSL